MKSPGRHAGPGWPRLKLPHTCSARFHMQRPDSRLPTPSHQQGIDPLIRTPSSPHSFRIRPTDMILATSKGNGTPQPSLQRHPTFALYLLRHPNRPLRQLDHIPCILNPSLPRNPNLYRTRPRHNTSLPPRRKIYLTLTQPILPKSSYTSYGTEKAARQHKQLLVSNGLTHTCLK